MYAAMFSGQYARSLHAADRIVNELQPRTRTILVDFHAEATSEKIALGRHLDGRVSAVLCTHTHVPTADARVLPGGTAYMTDVGMTGAYDSVIGVLTPAGCRPARFAPRPRSIWSASLRPWQFH